MHWEGLVLPREGTNTGPAELWVRKRGAGMGQLWEAQGWDLGLAVAGQVEQAATVLYPFHLTRSLARVKICGHDCLALFEPSSKGDLSLHRDFLQGGCPHSPSLRPVGLYLICFCFVFTAGDVVVLVCYKLVKHSVLNRQY